MIWAGKSSPGVFFPSPPKHLPSGFMGEKAISMNLWKKILSLDFEKEYIRSFLKLLFFWNPLWNLALCLLTGDREIESILFRWGWNFSELTLIGLFAMMLMKVYLWGEKLWTSRRGKASLHHRTGWYLLLLAFFIPPGLYLALRMMVTGINLFFPGDPISAVFKWTYYWNQIFWGWMLLLVCSLFISWQDLKEAANLSQLRAEELEKERLQALLTKLKDQMNPHFLFNTLNTVASLIPADPSMAEKVVVKLSTLFQGILAATRKTHQPLEKELEFCRDYLDIEKARFGSRLKVNFGIQGDIDPSRVWVPVLLFQPMVENAVKHGISTRANGGEIWIGAAEKNGHLELWVEDDGVGFGQSPYRGSGTALENCRKRLELGYGNEGRMEISNREGGGTRVCLILPLVTADPSHQEES